MIEIIWNFILLVILTLLGIRFVFLISKMNRLITKYEQEYTIIQSIVEKNQHCAECANFVDEAIFEEEIED